MTRTNLRNGVFEFTAGSSGAAGSRYGGIASANTPLPSIEPEPTLSPVEGSAPSAVADDRPRTWSFSLTPPESAGSTASTPATNTGSSSPVTRGERDVGSIDAQLRNVRLSNPIRMTEVANAINDISTSSDRRERSLLTPEPSEAASAMSTPLRSARRKRSSSQVNEPMHDVGDEHVPNDRFTKENFQSAFQSAKDLVARLSGVLGSNALRNEPDSSMQRLFKRAETLAAFKCPSTRTVGFVGDSGVGKSSLLNSLLDRNGLARTSNSGSACTCVVTEYHHHDSDEFKVQINYFTTEEIIDQVHDLLRAYRQYHLNSHEFSAAEAREFKDREEFASDTFRALFGPRSINQRVLQDRSEDVALGFLTELVHECRPANRTRAVLRSSLDECSKLIGQLTSETSEQASTGNPAIWPYIKNIQVYSNAHILSKGLILVDLPGLHDVNAARRNVTERYIRNCDEIFAVCTEGRAITDAGVFGVVELAKKARLSNVGIICTRSDDIKAEEAKRDWNNERATNVQSKQHAVKDSRDAIHRLEEELKEIEELGDDLSAEEQDEERRLGRKLRAAKEEQRQHIFELDEYLITTRNNIVQQELLAKYHGQVPGGRLHVHCVSNTLYWGHREKPKSKAMPYLQLSGILGIRQHCMALVSESRYYAALEYMETDIPALLGDAKLWVQSGSGSMSAEKKIKIRETLNTLEARLKQDLCGNGSQVNGFARSAKGEFFDSIYHANRGQILSWTRSAAEASADWSCWHHSTYAAFCSNRGSHTTNAAGTRDWNQEAIQSMVEDLEPSWEDMCTSLEELNEQMRESARGLFDWAAEYLDEELEDETRITEVLNLTFHYRQRLLEKDLEDASRKFLGALESLRVDALSGIRTSYIGHEMEESYRKASSEYGRGSDSRRKGIINDAFRRSQLFKDLLNRFKREFDSQVEDFEETMRQVVQSHLECTRVTLDLIRDDHVVLESERDPEFRARVEAGVGEADAEISRIRASFPR